MTLTTTTNRVTYPGADSAGPFAVPFRVAAAADLVVLRVSADTVETVLALTTDYAVSGVGNAAASVTLTAVLATGESLVILRAPALTQPTSIQNQGPFFPKTHEDVFDRLTMLLQAVSERLDRSFHVQRSVGADAFTTELPPGRAGQVLGVNDDADGLSFLTIPAAIVPVASSLHLSGTGSPEGAVAGAVGSQYIQTDGTNGAVAWKKTRGTGNTGWVKLSGDLAMQSVAEFGVLTLDNATLNDTVIQAAVDAVTGTGVVLVIPPLCRYSNAVIWKGVRHVSAQAPCLVNSTVLPAGSTNAGMRSDGAYLYVCEYTNHKIAVFDVSDRRNPRYISSTAAGGNNPRACAIIGDWLAVVCLGANSVRIFNRTAITPSFSFAFTTQATPKDLVVVNDRYLYVVCNSGYLQKWELDFVNLTAYKLWETATVGATPLHVSHYNGVLYVVGTSSIVDVFNANGTRIGGYEILTSTANSASLPVGRYLYVVSAGALDKLYVLDIKDPTTPALVTSIAVTDEPAWVEQCGRTLIVSSLNAAGPGSVDLIDITDPAAPVKYKTVATVASGTCFGTVVDDRFFYVDGHNTPFTVDAIELQAPEPRTALAQPIDGYTRRPRKIDTVIVDTSATTAHDVLRVGLGKTVTLPDPATIPLGKPLTIVNVSTTANVSITNAYAGLATGFKVPPGGVVTLLPTSFSGTAQWEVIGLGDFTRFAGSAVYDPPNLADGAGATTTVTVTGAALGDFAEASFSLDLQGITVTAWVSAADTVSVRFQNESGGALDLGSGTLRARVTKPQ